MAIFTQAFAGSGSGRVGANVYYRMNGKNIVRSRPGKYTDRNSTAQRNVRYGSFKPAVEFARLLKSFALQLYPVKPTVHNRYSDILQKVRPAFTGTEALPLVDLEQAEVGNGSIPVQDWLSVSRPTATTLTLAWDTGIFSPSMNVDDFIKVFMTDDKFQNVVLINTEVDRQTGHATIDIPTAWSLIPINISTIFATGDPQFHPGNDLAGKVRMASHSSPIVYP